MFMEFKRVEGEVEERESLLSSLHRVVDNE